MVAENMRLVLSQDFNWHDAAGSGEYALGEEGCLILDGSNSTIACYRFLKDKIADGAGSLDVRMSVVCGKPYHVRLYDSADHVVMDCLIDRDGWVKFRKGDEYANSGKYITLGLGQPCVDPEFTLPGWYARESDELTYSFGHFAFAKGSFEFTISGPDLRETVTLEGCLWSHAPDISRLELATGVIEPGTRIRLSQYKQYENGKVIDREEFPHYWEPVPAPPDGYPRDNICETKVRPVGNRWLETSTFYGWVKTHVPLLPEGEIEFEIMTPDVVSESCLQLGEYSSSSTVGHCPINVGIMGQWDGDVLIPGRFFCAVPERIRSDMLEKDFARGKIVYFDEPVPTAKRVHRVKVAWYRSGHYRLWIDGRPMKWSNSYHIPSTMKALRGIDTVYLHSGRAGTRPTLAQKKQGKRFPQSAEPHLTYWGGFRVYGKGATEV